MGLLSNLLSIAVLVIFSAATALGQAQTTPTGKYAYRGAVGCLVLLVFWLWRRVAQLETERDFMLRELKKETETVQTALTLREEMCKLSDGLSQR